MPDRNLEEDVDATLSHPIDRSRKPAAPQVGNERDADTLPIPDDTSIVRAHGEPDPNLGDSSCDTGSNGSIEDLPRFDGFNVKKKLGRGGMGTVFLAVDERLNRRVAIKVLNASVSTAANVQARFRQEAQTVAGLQHTNIAQLYSVEEHNGQPFLVMEFVDGTSLEERIQHSPQTPEFAAKTILSLAQAMQHCHEQGVVHRDLKPSNILVDSSDAMKIADFGLAKTLQGDSATTRTGEILGTPGYMAPEQASGSVETPGPACDIYGLGGVLYRLLTGRVPFDSPDPMHTVLMVISDTPVSPRKLQPSIPRDLETICLKCLEKSPRNRYSSASDLADDIKRFIDGRPIHARPASIVEKTLKWSRRRPALALLIALTFLAIPMVILAQWYHSDQLSKALERSQRLADEGSDFTTWVLEEHLGKLRTFQGTTPAQRDIVARVQNYLDAATPDAPPSSKFLRRHAESYRILADVLGSPNNQNLGETTLALKNYQTAIDWYNNALELDNSDDVAYRLRAVCYANMSALAFETDGPDARSKLLDKAVDSLSESPNKEGSQYWLAHAIVHQSIAEQHLGNVALDDALTEIAIVEDAVAKFKDDLPSPSNELVMWVARNRGDVHQRLGEFENALAAQRHAVEVSRDMLADSPDDPIVLNQLSANLIAVGDTQCYQQQFTAAIESYQEALDIREETALNDESNSSAQIGLGVALERMASVYLYLQEFDKALPISERTIALRHKLVAAEPDNRDLKRSLWIELQGRATILSGMGRNDDALAGHEEQIALIEELVDVEDPFAGDLCGLGQGYYYKAMITQSNMVNAYANDPSGNIRDHQLYKDAVEYFDRSLDAYGRAQELGELDQSQTSFLESVHTGRAFLDEIVQKFEALSDTPSE